MINKIISDGQTGACRAALDAAIKMGIPHGGWVPKGRIAENGIIPPRYHLQEMPTDGYPERTEQNIIESTGTLIMARGKLTGGTDYARQMTLKHKKQLLAIDLNQTHPYDAASLIASWLRIQRVEVLNVAGPRASEDPDIYGEVLKILEHAIQILKDEKRRSGAKSRQSEPLKTPKTVKEAVDRLITELSLKDKTTIANMAEVELDTLHTTTGAYIRNEFGLWSGNKDLLISCCYFTKKNKVSDDEASSVIIRELWKRLKETHKLRILK